MNKNIMFMLCFVFFHGKAQIMAPDTVCVGTPVNFTTPVSAITYSWDFDTVSVNGAISPATSLYSGPGLSGPTMGCFNKDGANYYYFATEYTTQHIKRISFGPSLYGTPTVTDLGSFGFTSGALDGIDIVKDSAANKWYGIAVNWDQMVVLDFGSALSNTPTGVTYTYSNIQYAHQVSIKRYMGNWIAFIANRNNGISRFDFGSSLSNIPTAVNLPISGGIDHPCNFSLYQQAGNWYMLITNLIGNTLTRYNFGATLTNNSPTGVSLGNPGGFLTLPRPINILNDCNNNVIAFVGNENGSVLKLDFTGSITNVPVPTFLGPSGAGHQGAASPCAYNDSFCILICDAGLNKIWKYHPFNFSTPTYTNYYNHNQSHTFTSTGLYHVSLFCDLGYAIGPANYCKDIYVTSGMGTTSSKDTIACTASSLMLTASTSGPYLWNTGAVSPSILVTTSGTYWVKTTLGPCAFRCDTFHVSLNSVLPVSLGPDVSICPGDSVVLHPSAPAGSTFSWNTGATTGSITINTPGIYWVKGQNGSCSGNDTINVSIKPTPVVNLGPDIIACVGSPVTLSPLNTYSSPIYLWNTGSIASSIDVTASGSYWVSVTVNGCTNRDTANVNFIPPPIVNLGEDTSVCSNSSFKLTAPTYPGALYLWNSGSTMQSIPATLPGLYTVTVTVGACTVKDSIQISNVAPPSIYLGSDTTVCLGSTYKLMSNSTDSTIWSNGSTSKSIAVQEPGGTYTVETYNGCGVGRDTINIEFIVCDLVFPNAFTPNSDGKNDLAKIYGDIRYISEYSLSIYNRWGERVFYTTNIIDGWDGRYNRIEQDLGTYYYMISYTANGQKHKLKGDLHLIR